MALSRRHFLENFALATSTAALGMSSLAARAAESAAKSDGSLQPRGKAEHCIFVWLGGGACHVDTWDPKLKGDGLKKPGSYYDPIDTAIPGVQVCQHLARTAQVLDRAAILRTIHHDVIDEHAAAVNRLHTGRPVSETVIYPSLGSVVAHERGALRDGAPAYVVMGYPNVTRGPGFLGSKYGYIYLTETDSGPNGLVRPADISDARQQRREALLGKVRGEYLERHPGERTLAEYAAVSVEGLRLARPEFMRAFDLKAERDSLREEYGGEFGQRCLLARRLVESGVRFTEVSFNLNFVNGTGWDTHRDGQKQQHVLIQQLDQALAALILDLETRKLLDKTLVVVATEFGRPPEFDAGGGRGHQPKGFSILLAGGGLKLGQAIGSTDELGKKIVDRPVSVADLHATIYATLGIDPAKELFAGDRPVPITDQGRVVSELFG